MSEEVRPVAGMLSRETYQYRMTKFVIAVPFDGEEDVFKLRATQSSFNPPSARYRGRAAPVVE